MKRRGGERGLLQIEVTYKAEIINIAEYMNTKYIKEQFVNTVKVTKAINQTRIQQFIIQTLKKKNGKQINAWPLY